MLIFVQIIETIDLVVRPVKARTVDIQNGKRNIVWVMADHGCYFHPLSYQVTKLRNYTKGEIREISVFDFDFN